MQKANTVPSKLIRTFSDLLPREHDYGWRVAPIREKERQFFPADFVESLYNDFLCYLQYYPKNNHDHKYAHSLVLPKIYLLLYQITLAIPNTHQLVSVVKGDANFANACCFPHPEMPYIGVQGLSQFQNTLLQLPDYHRVFQETLHNLSDEIDYKKIAIGGLIPSIWVQTFQKAKQQAFPVYDPDFEAVFANNTGIDIIDEITLHLPLDFRSDIRQESALNCLRLGINNLTRDDIANITKMAMKHSRNEYFQAKYTTKSLFSKPYPDSNVELWQTITDPKAENPQVITERNEEEALIRNIAANKQQIGSKVLVIGDINCNHKISINLDDDGNKIAICVHCRRKALLANQDTNKEG